MFYSWCKTLMRPLPHLCVPYRVPANICQEQAACRDQVDAQGASPGREQKHLCGQNMAWNSQRLIHTPSRFHAGSDNNFCQCTVWFRNVVSAGTMVATHICSTIIISNLQRRMLNSCQCGWLGRYSTIVSADCW